MFGYNTDKTETKLLFIDIYLLYINDARFKSTKEWMSYLYGSPYPKIWRSGGSVMDLPKGLKHPRAYPIDSVDFYYDNFNVVTVSNYPVNNFHKHIL